MPFDVLGRTRATLIGRMSLREPPSFPVSAMGWENLGDNSPNLGRKAHPGNLRKPNRDGDRPLQLLAFNEEFLVGAVHQIAPITSLPFVHTAEVGS